MLKSWYNPLFFQFFNFLKLSYDFNHETAICENTLGTPFRAFCECDLAFVKEISRFEKENAIGKNSGYRLRDCVKPEPPTEPVEPPVTGCCESETGLFSHFNKGSVI